jgi:3-hydroxybutyryl-CoA dehydratase
MGTVTCDKRAAGPASSASAASLALADFAVGLSFSFDKHIDEADIDAFAALSGDQSPIHMSHDFARARGFDGRVVHGAYLAGLASRMVGMHLPGENCLLHAVQMKFLAPTYTGTSVRVSAVVDQVSDAAGAAVIKVTMTDGAAGDTLAHGKITIGFTGMQTS